MHVASNEEEFLVVRSVRACDLAEDADLHSPRAALESAREAAHMSNPQVVRLDETERVSFGPLSHYQPIIGDEAGSTPLRTGIQTAQPGYVAPVHSHPYLEVLH